jgi:hypothetical protein
MTRIAAIALTVAALACDSEETTGGHTPVDAALFVGGVEVTGDLLLDAGQTTQVEVRFQDDHGEEITGIEGGHFAALLFTPATLATTAYATGRHFLIDVTAQASAGTGTLRIGYGHSEAEVDELTFGPITVVVQ